jgi:hypothetical protein
MSQWPTLSYQQEMMSQWHTLCFQWGTTNHQETLRYWPGMTSQREHCASCRWGMISGWQGPQCVVEKGYHRKMSRWWRPRWAVDEARQDNDKVHCGMMSATTSWWHSSGCWMWCHYPERDRSTMSLINKFPYGVLKGSTHNVPLPDVPTIKIIVDRYSILSAGNQMGNTLDIDLYCLGMGCPTSSGESMYYLICLKIEGSWCVWLAIKA